MTKQAADRHQELERQLIDGRLSGDLSPDQDDAISEEMENLWYEMDDIEQKEAERRVAAYAEAMSMEFLLNKQTETASSSSEPSYLVADTSVSFNLFGHSKKADFALCMI